MSEFEKSPLDLSVQPTEFAKPPEAGTKLCSVCLVDRLKCAGQSHSKFAVQARTYTINKRRSHGTIRTWLKYISKQQRELPRNSSGDTTSDVQRFDCF
jgi:hypothetical protein